VKLESVSKRESAVRLPKGSYQGQPSPLGGHVSQNLQAIQMHRTTSNSAGTGVPGTPGVGVLGWGWRVKKVAPGVSPG
jgi:hypothetical protein